MRRRNNNSSVIVFGAAAIAVARLRPAKATSRLESEDDVKASAGGRKTHFLIGRDVVFRCPEVEL
jgi:hypothetical protein